MSLSRLTTENFRNLSNQSVDFHPELNFVFGENGSGKSSLLEAFFFLGHGKSFRTSKFEHLAKVECDSFVVSAKDNEELQFGLSKNLSSGLTSIRINGESHSRLSALVRNIAVQVVTPESFKVFFGGPKERRRFVDLGMFHVKHEFSTNWKEFSRLLKQRNACLRNKAHASDMDYWNRAFCQSSKLVADTRRNYTLELEKELTKSLQVLLPKVSERVRLNYYQGWSQSRDLENILSDSYDRELAYGHSLYGAHKFDVKFLVDKQPIETGLSRGQQKLFLLALTFAQANLIAKVNRVKPILLIDDVGAELDLSSRQRLAKVINKMDCQVIITAIEQSVFLPFLESLDADNSNKEIGYKMFHVKHGELSPIMNQK